MSSLDHLVKRLIFFISFRQTTKKFWDQDNSGRGGGPQVISGIDYFCNHETASGSQGKCLNYITRVLLRLEKSMENSLQRSDAKQFLGKRFHESGTFTTSALWSHGSVFFHLWRRKGCKQDSHLSSWFVTSLCSVTSHSTCRYMTVAVCCDKFIEATLWASLTLHVPANCRCITHMEWPTEKKNRWHEQSNFWNKSLNFAEERSMFHSYTAKSWFINDDWYLCTLKSNSKPANKPSTSCVRTACPNLFNKYATSCQQFVTTLLILSDLLDGCSIQSWYNSIVTTLCRQPCNILVISRLYQTCCNNLATSLIMPSNLLQVVNSLFQTCCNNTGTSSANTTCWQLVNRFVTTCMQTCN